MKNNERRKQQLEKEGTLHPNPDKVNVDLIDKSPFFNANDLTQMKYEMLRSVNVEKKSVTEAAHLFGLSRVAYYSAQEKYQKHGLIGLLPNRRGPKYPRKFTPEVISFINDQLTSTSEQPNWNFLSRQIEDKFGIKVHPRSIERVVKQKKGDTQ